MTSTFWSEEKRLEKLDCMHGNPVKRRLVETAADWPWSSWRFYPQSCALIPAHVHRLDRFR